MRGEKEIHTPRLTLRKLRAEDAEALVAGVGPFDVSKWLTAVPHPYTREDARAFITHAATRPFIWGIEYKRSLVGTISAGGELGYWLARDAWGRGIATEAACAVTTRWFSNPDAPDLAASHFTENAASGAVLEKIGFTYTGETRLQYPLSRGEEPVESRLMLLTRSRWNARNVLPDLITPRCRLRPLVEDDAEELAAIGGVYEVARNTSSIPSPWPVEEAREWIARGLWSGRPGFRLAICNHDGALLGLAGLSPANDAASAEVAYLLRRDLWGQGIVTEVMAAFVPAVFRAFALEALEADHDTDNPASGAVLRKLGFTYMGDRINEATRLRLEPTPVSHYRLERSSFEARS